ncbi:hypothetical protein CTKA_01058 [Chthonomonas calidirosea]|uniref:Uncharacterized protein n=1 Tax=Chthonomonas calidirosea (strain DSM 23976 / ICMP 18418 / T49) TaxID=1303518 RepID=S0ES85_CHTCT|nr:hypothetical protein [Chthonomonas calidirosea]CCW33939.1 hypothetical protein CCALI_00100 [Chthonomonas calidirosea T49]CEK16226.1 hypothetical protein CTKA_01058 [Chthonomonas calidirosea]
MGLMRRLSLSLIGVLAVLQGVRASANPAIQQPRDGHVISIEALGKTGHYIGFEVFENGKPIVPVHFTSEGVIFAPHADVIRHGDLSRLVFPSLKTVPNSGLQLSHSRIEVTLRAGHFPKVFFDLTVAHFSPTEWQQKVGKQPFHFLKILMPSALLWQHGGWLNATPRADLFPLLLDVHGGTPELSAYPYNREWSTTPPVSAQPLPLTGLWDPEHGLYAAWDFQEARLTDNSERDIASGFCNRLITPTNGEVPPTDALKEGVNDDGESALTPLQRRERNADREGRSKFVALVYPYGGLGYQQCVYPTDGAHIASFADLVFSRSLGPTADPNSFNWQRWWRNPFVRARLPRVPTTVDLSYIGAAGHMNNPPEAPGGSLLAGPEGNFQIPGSLLIDGWYWHNESAVAAPVKQGDSTRIEALEREAAIFLKYTKRFSVNGKPCAYWEKPLVGRWTDPWGGQPVTTLHNANGFAAARLLLDLYHYVGKKEYLPYVEGAYNWATQMVWTRCEFADVPSSPFAIGATLPIAFLLDYYFTFKNDPAHHTRAVQALELARSYVYRYMVMWTADSRRDDSVSSAFLWEPNSGRDWTGAACANEVFWDLDTLAQVAVHTGDPILMWALQGSLSRWYRLYQDNYHSSLNDYLPSEFAEEYGLAPGSPFYPGHHAHYGFGVDFAMMDPVGDTVVRVLAGEKAAMAFDRDGSQLRLARYVCTGDGDFAFRLVGEPSGPFGVTITFPYGDLSAKPIVVRSPNGDERAIEVQRDPKALWTVVVRGVYVGDTVIVGHPDLAHAKPLPTKPPLTAAEAPIAAQAYAPFVSLPLSTDTTLPTSWSDKQAFAGLWVGLKWIDWVPFVRSEGPLRGASKPVRWARPLEGLQDVYLLYTALPQGQDTAVAPQVLLENGQQAKPIYATPALAWEAWPPVMSARLLLAGYEVPVGQRVVGIDPNGRTVIAAVGLPSGASQAVADQVAKAMQQDVQRWEAMLRFERIADSIRALASQVPQGAFAILPYTQNSSSVVNLLDFGDFRSRCDQLTPEQLVNPQIFNAEKYKAVFDLDGEDYLDTVHQPHDAAEALQSYLQQGGTLVLLTGLPYPLYYAQASGQLSHADPLLPRLGLPLYNAIETMPQDRLEVQEIEGQHVLTDLPQRFAYPDGDPRLRSVDLTSLPAGATLEPIYRVVGASGKDYGVAAALVTLPPGPDGKRGRILYISDVLLHDDRYSPLILEAVVRWVVQGAAGS